MSNYLHNVVNAIEQMDVQLLQDNLDFLGSYSGLTSHNFSRNLESTFKYIQNILYVNDNLIAKEILIESLKENEKCYVFTVYDEVLLCLIFKIKDFCVIDIIDNSKHMVDIDVATSCLGLLIYEDDKANYTPSKKHNIEINLIEEAIENLILNNEFGGISFESCKLWYYKNRHLRNNNCNGPIYRFKQEITFILDHVYQFIKIEMMEFQLRLKQQIGSFFDLTNERENSIYNQIAALQFGDCDIYDNYVLGYEEVNLPYLKLLPINNIG